MRCCGTDRRRGLSGLQENYRTRSCPSAGPSAGQCTCIRPHGRRGQLGPQSCISNNQLNHQMHPSCVLAAAHGRRTTCATSELGRHAGTPELAAAD